MACFLWPMKLHMRAAYCAYVIQYSYTMFIVTSKCGEGFVAAMWHPPSHRTSTFCRRLWAFLHMFAIACRT
jgi:hypothetical protein